MTAITPSPPAKLGERIVWARNQKKISQEKLAELIGTSRRHLIRIEKGIVARPGDHFLERIAEATEQPVEIFLELVTDPEEAARLGDTFRGDGARHRRSPDGTRSREKSEQDPDTGGEIAA